MEAPVVVAMGADHLAFGFGRSPCSIPIPILERKPLGSCVVRTAWRSETRFHYDLYQAVSEVLSLRVPTGRTNAVG